MADQKEHDDETNLDGAILAVMAAGCLVGVVVGVAAGLSIDTDTKLTYLMCAQISYMVLIMILGCRTAINSSGLTVFRPSFVKPDSPSSSCGLVRTPRRPLAVFQLAKLAASVITNAFAKIGSACERVINLIPDEPFHWWIVKRSVQMLFYGYCMVCTVLYIVPTWTFFVTVAIPWVAGKFLCMAIAELVCLAAEVLLPFVADLVLVFGLCGMLASVVAVIVSIGLMCVNFPERAILIALSPIVAFIGIFVPTVMLGFFSRAHSMRQMIAFGEKFLSKPHKEDFRLYLDHELIGLNAKWRRRSRELQVKTKLWMTRRVIVALFCMQVLLDILWVWFVRQAMAPIRKTQFWKVASVIFSIIFMRWK